MDDFYAKLERHFSGNASNEENLEMATFKELQPDDYLMYKELWANDKSFKVKDYNSLVAWNKIQAKTKAKKSKWMIIIRRVAAVLLIGCLSALVLYQVSKPANIHASKAHHFDSKTNVELADGSEVLMNKKSVLSYPNKFSNGSRTVKLNGEAFFNVERDTAKPFVIKTDNATITVLGTSFNVKSTSTVTSVSVVSGSVLVESTAGEQCVLTKGESVTASDNLFETKKLGNQNFLAWKTGVFSFDQQPLHEVIVSLNTYYNNSLVLKKGLENCLLSADFNDAELKDVVEVLELTCNAQIDIKK